MSNYTIIITNFSTGEQEDIPFCAPNNLVAMQELNENVTSYIDYDPRFTNKEHNLDVHLFEEFALRPIKSILRNPRHKDVVALDAILGEGVTHYNIEGVKAETLKPARLWVWHGINDAPNEDIGCGESWHTLGEAKAAAESWENMEYPDDAVLKFYTDQTKETELYPFTWTDPRGDTHTEFRTYKVEAH